VLHRRLIVFALAFCVPLAAHAAPCKPTPSGKPPETNVVFIKFEGCASAEPKEPFDVRVGDEPVRVAKTADNRFWRGETSTSFPVNRPRALVIDYATMSNVRTACTPVPERDGWDAPGCVMLYHVPCEPTWLLNVKVPERAAANLSYERRPEPTTVAACPDTIPRLPRGTGDISLANSEKILVKVEVRQDRLLPVPVWLKDFAGNRTTLTLRDLAPEGIVENTAVSTGRAINALRKSQIHKVLENLLLTRVLTATQ